MYYGLQCDSWQTSEDKQNTICLLYAKSPPVMEMAKYALCYHSMPIRFTLRVPAAKFVVSEGTLAAISSIQAATITGVKS